MNELRVLLEKVESLMFSGNQRCIELLDNRLQDILVLVKDKPSGELIELMNCSWTLHERYHMDDEEQLKWTFHHAKHRILKNAGELLLRMERKAILLSDDGELKNTA